MRQLSCFRTKNHIRICAKSWPASLHKIATAARILARKVRLERRKFIEKPSLKRWMFQFCDRLYAPVPPCAPLCAPMT